MNILMLTDRMDAGGAETHIFTLAKELSAMGHSVAVVSGGGRTARRLSANGVRHYSLPLGSRSPKDVLFCAVSVTRIAKKENADLIHAHARMAALIGSFAVKMLKIPLVTTAHAKFSADRLRASLSRWGTLTCAVSEDIKQYLCESYGVYPDNIQVIHNGIDVRSFKPAQTPRSNGLHLVFMSRMDSDCSLTAHALCAIAPRLRRHFPTLRMTLAGGGDALPSVRKAARMASERCGMRIDTVGHVGNTPRLLRSADIFVGVSRAALEAMACGVPTVISGNEGYFGAVTPDSFFRAESDNFCARGGVKLQINALYSDIYGLCAMKSEEREALGKALSKAVSENHSAEEMALRTAELYRAALGRVPCERGDIVLCGYYGYGNAGDDALLSGALRRAGSEHPDMTVSALTAKGKPDSERFGVRCVRRKSPISALREIRNARLFVFGGGTLLQDTTSKRSLFYYLFLLRYAQKRGVRCELWANGIGHLRVRLLRLLCSRALSGCSHIGVRDVRSAYSALTLTRGACVLPELEDDLACGTPASDSARTELLLSSYLSEPSEPFAAIAINGSMLLRKGGKAELARLIHRLRELKQSGLSLLFVAMHAGEDRQICLSLARRFGKAAAVGLSPSDLVAIFARADIVCASRFHALLFAKMSGTPFEVFGNDPKLFTLK